MVLGGLVGLLVGLLGAGGSIVTIPVLMLLLGLSATQATGTSLVVVSIVSTVGLLTHARGGRVAWRAGLGFAATGVPAALGGGYLAVLLPDATLTVVLVVLLFGTSVYMWFREDADDPAAARSVSWWRILTAGVVVGLMTGTLGVGGGFAVVPALVALLGLSMPVAVGTSQVVLVLNALAGLAGRAGSGSVVLTVGLVFAGGGVVGAVVASRLVARAGGRWLSRTFAVLLVIVSAALLGQLVV